VFDARAKVRALLASSRIVVEAEGLVNNDTMLSNPIILAHHLILSGYGFWLANDPRGSGSEELREVKFADLGPIHHGRKRVQPTREELRQFYARAFPRLEHKPIWFDQVMRHQIAEDIRGVVTRKRYTVWACFVGSNHAHLCIRRHRDTYQTMWGNLTSQAHTTFASRGLIDPAHPLWAQRPYSVFCHTPDDIRRVIAYIEGNPEKEGLPPQRWDFVKPYDGWPFTNERFATR
jgi:hypothetical protein